MSHWHPHPAARIGLRLLGLGLIASLGPQGRLLHLLVDRSAGVTLAQFAVAATAFLSASLGMALLLLGPDLWKPVRVAPRWTRRDASTRASGKRA
ncbi:hypothetical protein EBBID32_9850 [Sphingobium indicum BiD32]|uniref:Uncharacterized protein n=1 Tax=Sphingobium indicum BiD32 TaxID=1301087 RepID=N1MM19_9SPHN|nr:hypothetical protein [Sphingobium indicum]CCW16647.1 hypothetical protein EBBID32_9850 [Sphingobium indicum BiD32]